MNLLPPLLALKAFEAAGSLQSISLAAEQLHVTPAAISRQIRALETYLGVELFLRQHRAVRLSRAGMLYLEAVRKHLDGLRSATLSVSNMHSTVDVRLSVPPTFAVRWLMPRLADFHRQYPSVSVQISTVPAEAVGLEHRPVDASIRFGRGGWSGLRAVPLVSNLVTPVATAALWSNGPAGAPETSLGGRTLLYSLTRPDDWRLWMAKASVAAPPRVHRLEYESSLLAYQAALSGLGIAIGQLALLREEIDNGTLTTPFDTVADMGPLTYYFVQPPRKSVSPELRLLSDWICSIAPGA